MIASGWKNVEGSSKTDKCQKCGTWRNHWKELCGLDRIIADKVECAICGCNDAAEDGAHIENAAVNDEYIVPLCKPCNHRTDTFTLKKGTVIVLADPEETCENPGPTKVLKEII